MADKPKVKPSSAGVWIGLVMMLLSFASCGAGCVLALVCDIVLVAEDAAMDAHAWLGRAQALERENDRVRDLRWGPRTLDVDLIVCADAGRDIRNDEPTLTLPHPQAHRRAFVLVPWLAIDPSAELTVDGRRRPVKDLLEELDRAERQSVRPTKLVLRRDRR